MKYFIILMIFFIISCSENQKKSEKILQRINEVEQPDQFATNVTVFFYDSNLTKAILKSKQARVFSNKNITYLDSSVYVEFFSKDSQKRISFLTSDSARIDDITKDMIATGNVKVISDSNNITLETNILEWSNSRQIIYTNQFIKITTDKEIIYGYGFESLPNLTQYKIFKVSGIQKIKE